MLKRVLMIFPLSLSHCRFCGDSGRSIPAGHIKISPNEDLLSCLRRSGTHHIVYLNGAYQNRTYFTGRDIGVNQYNVSLMAAYHYRGFTASAGALIYSEFEPHWNLTQLSLGYRRQFFRKLPLEAGISYGRYCFHDPDDSLTVMYPNSLALDLSYAAPHWGLMLDPVIFFGDGSTAQISASVFGDLPLLRLKGGSRFKLKPRIGVIFGNEPSAYTELPGALPPLTAESFGLLNTEIVIPLLWYCGDLDIRAGFHYNIPHAPGGDTAYAPTSFISLSAGYIFSFAGK